jgi:hypothetical protein
MEKRVVVRVLSEALRLEVLLSMALAVFAAELAADTYAAVRVLSGREVVAARPL